MFRFKFFAKLNNYFKLQNFLLTFFNLIYIFSIFTYMIAKLLLEGSEKDIWKDFYFNEKRIDGFYVPDQDDELEPFVNILIGSNVVSVKEDPELLEYLIKTFIDA